MKIDVIICTKNNFTKNVSKFMKVVRPCKYHVERYKSIINNQMLEVGPVAQFQSLLEKGLGEPQRSIIFGVQKETW